jgi:hypothetical protein
LKAAAGALAAVACLLLTHCGSPARPSTARGAPAEPRWEDVVDTTPELLGIVFPLALRRDPVYGPLLRRAIALVREQSRVVAETRALDSMEDAEEVIVGVRPEVGIGRSGAPPRTPEDSEEGGEAIVVVRGVRADEDPAALVDAEGHPLWAPGPSGGVRELVRSDSTASTGGAPPIPASLFELPGRTWVIVSGAARARARDVFAHPRGRPALPLETRAAGALLLLRIDGPSLVARVRALQSPRGLAAVGRGLEALTLVLDAAPAAPAGEPVTPGAASPTDTGAPVAELGPPHRSVRVTLTYTDAPLAMLAEATVRDVIGAIARKKPDDLAWLAGATVDRSPSGAASGVRGQEAREVVVTAALPPRLVGALLRGGVARPTATPLP